MFVVLEKNRNADNSNTSVNCGPPRPSGFVSILFASNPCSNFVKVPLEGCGTLKLHMKDNICQGFWPLCYLKLKKGN